MAKLINTEKFIENSNVYHNGKFNYDKTIYVNDKTKVEIVCSEHGSFFTLPSSHTKTSFGGCAECAGNRKYSTEDFIKKAKLFHQNNFDYSLVNYIANDQHVKIICKIHGEFDQTPSNHYKYGCLKCSGKELKSKEDFILESILIHKGMYDYSEVDYDGMFKKIKILCKKHGEFNQLPTNHLHGKRGCPKCSKRISRNEIVWLDSLGLPNDSDHRNVYIKIDDKKYFVDGFDPSTNTIYEYNGDYWHGNLAVYDANAIHPVANVSYKVLWNKTEDKIKVFEKANYKVVSIWESEFLNSVDKIYKITIQDNKYAQISINDSAIFNKLKKKLSFKTEGVEYTAAFRNGWNGITYLLDVNGYFLLGLLNKVKEFLDENNLKYSIIDKRKPVNSNGSINLSDKLKTLNMVPRDYQERIVEAALNNNKGIVRACTGSGKTLCTALIAAKINKPTIIYVIGLDLLKQFHDLFTSLFDEPIGFIGNGTCEIHRINIASIWSISSALKIKPAKSSLDDENNDKEISPSQKQSEDIIKMLQETKMHIFDESHIITTDTIKNIFSKIDPEYIYGFSGTPFRDDGSDLLINAILGEQIVNVSASELIASGHLAQALIKFVRVPKTYVGTGTQNYQTVYKEYITENEIRNNLIIKNTEELLTKNYQVLILFKHLQHGKNLCKLFDDKNINYEYLSGADSLEERIKVKENLLSKKSNLVLASSIFDIGVDISSLSALVLAGGGKSSIRTLQRIGRVIRKFTGKKYVAIIDFFDDVKFLKAHSKKRYQIYSSELGFKLLIPSDLSYELI